MSDTEDINLDIHQDFHQDPEQEKKSLDELVSASARLCGDLLYTAIYDLSNDLIKKGLDEALVLECANELSSRYFSDGIKVRKKPAPRTSKPSTKTSGSSSAKTKKVSGKTISWIFHPSTEEFSYTPDITLTNGFPLRDNSTQKVIGTINKDGVGYLTMEDMKTAFLHELMVDMSNLRVKSES